MSQRREVSLVPSSERLLTREEAQTVKSVRGGALAGLREIQPYPRSDNLGKLVMVRQFPFQQVLNRFRGQFAVGVVSD